LLADRWEDLAGGNPEAECSTGNCNFWEPRQTVILQVGAQ
jgi:hypothetical protein